AHNPLFPPISQQLTRPCRIRISDNMANKSNRRLGAFSKMSSCLEGKGNISPTQMLKQQPLQPLLEEPSVQPPLQPQRHHNHRLSTLQACKSLQSTMK
ncbi:hypothetical protein BX616_009904, partial [Lobosporangium transversale]